VKLTKEIKSEIIRSAIKSVFAERQEWIRNRENILAKTIYKTLYPPAIQSKMNALPDIFFAQRGIVYVHIPTFSRYRIALSMQSSRKVSAADSHGYEQPCMEFSESDPMVADIKMLESDKKVLDGDKEMLKSKLNLLLAGINTKNQLKSEWPEGEIYYKDILPEERTANLPAIRGKEITKMIQKLK